MYSTTSLIFTGSMLAFFIAFSIIFRKVKPNIRLNILRAISLIGILFHLSLIPYHYFTNPTAPVSMLGSAVIPYNFCNIAMWGTFLTFWWPKTLRKLYPFIINAALIGGILTIALPDFYNAQTQNFFYWPVFKGFMSHFMLIFAGLYANVSGEFKPRVKDLWVFVLGMVLCLAYGYGMIALFEAFSLNPPNSMYLLRPALSGTPFSGYFIGGIAIAVIVLITVLNEELFYKKEERFISNLFKKAKKAKK